MVNDRLSAPGGRWNRSAPAYRPRDQDGGRYTKPRNEDRFSPIGDRGHYEKDYGRRMEPLRIGRGPPSQRQYTSSHDDSRRSFTERRSLHRSPSHADDRHHSLGIAVKLPRSREEDGRTPFSSREYQEKVYPLSDGPTNTPHRNDGPIGRGKNRFMNKDSMSQKKQVPEKSSLAAEEGVVKHEGKDSKAVAQPVMTSDQILSALHELEEMKSEVEMNIKDEDAAIERYQSSEPRLVKALERVESRPPAPPSPMGQSDISDEPLSSDSIRSDTYDSDVEIASRTTRGRKQEKVKQISLQLSKIPRLKGVSYPGLGV